MEGCIFCKVLAREIPSYRVYEDEHVLAFLDINPVTRGHTLVAPKEHVSSFSRAGEGTLKAMVKASARVAQAIGEALEPEGFNYLINEGRTAGQLVDHLHMHVTPRYREGELEFNASKLDLSEEELESLAEKIAGKV